MTQLNGSKDRVLTLLVHVDALRYDYINESDSPFLVQLSRGGISGRLQPTFGFEPDGAYLAGLYPDECDSGAHYWHQPETSPFRWISYLTPLLRLCPKGFPERAIRKALDSVLRRTTQLKHETVANIPFDLLRYFAPAEHSPFVEGFSDYPTLFSLCSENGVVWLWHPPGLFRTRVEDGVKRLKDQLKPPVRFAFWYISDLDGVGHRYGPLSPECRTAMSRVDAGIRTLSLHLERHYDRIDWIVIGDHGMVQVHNILDVRKKLTRAGIKQGQGVVYFLDSTMARFWFFEERARSHVFSLLEELQGGRVLGQSDRDLYHLNYPHNRFGDLFFLADPAILISPNFYQGNERVRGMHGYAPEFPDQQTAIIINSPCVSASSQLESPVDMRGVFPTVLNLLDIAPPNTCHLTSLA